MTKAPHDAGSPAKRSGALKWGSGPSVGAADCAAGAGRGVTTDGPERRTQTVARLTQAAMASI